MLPNTPLSPLRHEQTPQSHNLTCKLKTLSTNSKTRPLIMSSIVETLVASGGPESPGKPSCSSFLQPAR
jgi:hypothetical protein